MLKPCYGVRTITYSYEVFPVIDFRFLAAYGLLCPKKGHRNLFDSSLAKKHELTVAVGMTAYSLIPARTATEGRGVRLI